MRWGIFFLPEFCPRGVGAGDPSPPVFGAHNFSQQVWVSETKPPIFFRYAGFSGSGSVSLVELNGLGGNEEEEF